MSAITRHGPGNLWMPPEPQEFRDIAGTAQALISGQQFITNDGKTHNFESLMQFIYGQTEDSDDLEACIQAVAMGPGSASFATKRIEKIIYRAAEAYVSSWIHQLEQETQVNESEPFFDVRGAV